jgi:hypothetical protein
VLNAKPRLSVIALAGAALAASAAGVSARTHAVSCSTAAASAAATTAGFLVDPALGARRSGSLRADRSSRGQPGDGGSCRGSDRLWLLNRLGRLPARGRHVADFELRDQEADAILLPLLGGDTPECASCGTDDALADLIRGRDGTMEAEGRRRDAFAPTVEADARWLAQSSSKSEGL